MGRYIRVMHRPCDRCVVSRLALCLALGVGFALGPVAERGWTQPPLERQVESLTNLVRQQAEQVQQQSRQIQAQAAQLQEQARQLQQLQQRVQQAQQPGGTPATARHVTNRGDSCQGALVRVPLVADLPPPPHDECVAVDQGHTGGEPPAARALPFYADYDQGFRIRPFAPERHPFELKVNGWIQFRHHGFARDVATWTDNAGVVRPVTSRNAFDVERGRLVFSGFAGDPRSTYFLQLDGDTDGGEIVDFFDYWWAWQLTDTFKIQAGKRKVTAGRQWLLGARDTRFVDRPMANDFFRPDRTVGIFGVGTWGEHGHYEVMLGNGFRTANLANSVVDNLFTVALTQYVDPWGEFGGPLVDFSDSPKLRVRLGHSLVYSPQAAGVDGRALTESDFVRLSDGTRLTQTSALAPGAAVSEFDVYLYGLDAAFKWQGWSGNAELFFRWIEELQANQPLPIDDLFQHGFYVEGGRFLIPGKLDLNARYSQVAGEFGTATEYAAGVNWYPFAELTTKVSFDVTVLDGSPLQNTASDILVGDDGTLFRTQFQTQF